MGKLPPSGQSARYHSNYSKSKIQRNIAFRVAVELPCSMLRTSKRGLLP